MLFTTEFCISFNIFSKSVISLPISLGAIIFFIVEIAAFEKNIAETHVFIISRHGRVCSH